MVTRNSLVDWRKQSWGISEIESRVIQIDIHFLYLGGYRRVDNEHLEHMERVCRNKIAVSCSLVSRSGAVVVL